MAPGKAHEDAILIIREQLKKEFNLNDHAFCNWSVFGLRPDIWFIHPETGKAVVIEVGNTNAEKIHRYQKSGKVQEIRWYTKFNREVRLVAQWDGEAVKSGRISPMRCQTHLSEKQLKKMRERISEEMRELDFSMEAYVACTGCGTPHQLKNLSPIRHYGRDYLVCVECKQKGQFSTSGELHDALFYYRVGNRRAV